MARRILVGEGSAESMPRRSSVTSLVALLACCAAAGCSVGDVGPAPGPVATYVYDDSLGLHTRTVEVTDDGVRLARHQTTPVAGLIDFARPTAVLAMVDGELHQLDRHSGDMLAIGLPPGISPEDPTCDYARRLMALDETRVALVGGRLSASTTCPDAGGGEALWVWIHEQGTGWVHYAPADADALLARLAETLDFEAIGRARAIKINAHAGTVVYQLAGTTADGGWAIQARFDLHTWDVEWLDWLPCPFNSSAGFRNGSQWIQCRDEAERYHCVLDRCNRVDLGDKRPLSPEAYDHSPSPRAALLRDVFYDGYYLEDYRTHQLRRLPVESGVTWCRPSMFADPVDPTLTRIATTTGELLYDAATGAITRAPDPVFDVVVGRACAERSDPGGRITFFAE